MKEKFKIEVGENYLITTDNWFVAPDGQSYNSVFGTIHEICNDSVLGIKTNRHSTDWFMMIGNMLIAGCQIHYVVKVPEVSISKFVRDVEHKGNIYHRKEFTPRIYNAN